MRLRSIRRLTAKNKADDHSGLDIAGLALALKINTRGVITKLGSSMMWLYSTSTCKMLSIWRLYSCRRFTLHVKDSVWVNGRLLALSKKALNTCLLCCLMPANALRNAAAIA